MLGKYDLSRISSGDLAAIADQLYGQGKYRAAVILQRWSLTNSGGKRGRYNLACYSALAGDVDAAIYWLQEDARTEGVDAAWAAEDGDLETVRSDPRWPQLKSYLERYMRYWTRAGIEEFTLIVPRGYDGKRPIAVLIGLHGLGGRAKTFVSPEYQGVADRAGIAILGVSGTVPTGPTSFSWSEDVARDKARIDRALRQVADRLTIAPGQIVLFGFSQGAAMSIELAATYPKQYAGALSLSAGKRGEAVMPGAAKRTPLHKRQGYVVVVGAGEHPGNVSMARTYADQAQKLGARVSHKAYAGMNKHTFPPDYARRLIPWLRFILDPTRSAPTPTPTRVGPPREKATP